MNYVCPLVPEVLDEGVNLHTRIFLVHRWVIELGLTTSRLTGCMGIHVLNAATFVN